MSTINYQSEIIEIILWRIKMLFETLKLSDWKMFSEVNLDMHPKVTILTGANGSGKTTLMNLLARHFEWNFHELSTPALDPEKKEIIYYQYYHDRPQLISENTQIGELKYSNGHVSPIIIKKSNTPQYQLKINNQASISGLNIPANRCMFSYKALSQIELQRKTKRDAFNYIRDSSRNLTLDSNSEPANLHMKRVLYSWAVHGVQEKPFVSNPAQKNNFSDFENILRIILPESLGFSDFSWYMKYENPMMAGH